MTLEILSWEWLYIGLIGTVVLSGLVFVGLTLLFKRVELEESVCTCLFCLEKKKET